MFKRTMLAAGVLAVSQGVQAQSVEDLQKQVDILAQEVERLKEDKSDGGLEKVSIGGYGEHHYNNYRGQNSGDDMVDAHRFVLFVGYDYNDDIRFFSELEVEHAYAGEGEPGAVELEQAYIEFDTTDTTRVKVGQFLVPVGILNPTHEPDTFYGVERNVLESAIVPSTWWETGAWFTQDLGNGLSYDLAFHSGLEVGDDYDIRGGRQKSAKAVANDGALTGRVKYNGIAGLNLSLTVQEQSDVHQSAPDSVCTPENRGCELGFADGDDVPDANARLIEAHARYSIAGLQLTAQHARWDIDSDVAEIIGADEQEGTMFEAGYKFINEVGVFARHTVIDTNAGSEDNLDEETVVQTGGVNYWPHPRVVLKADYQDFEYKSDAGDGGENRFNLGLGWSF